MLFGRGMLTTFGADVRTDNAHVALHRQIERENFFTVNKISVAETSFAGYWGQEIFFTDWLRFEGGLRGDVFVYSVKNALPPGAANPASDPNFTGVTIDGQETVGIFSPKANLVVTPVTDTDVYLNFGEGYHSNDARNAILGKGTGFDPLTKSLGYELGARTRQFDRLDASAAIWRLDLDSELVLSGDGGNQETGAGGNFVPAGPSRRWGIDFEARYQLTRWLYADYDLSYADSRFKNGDAIPLAPTLLMNGGLTAEFRNGFSVALRNRFLDDRPANEDRTLTAQGYYLLDLIAKYRWRNLEGSLSLLNLTDTDWREAQFTDTSCVRREVGRAVGCVAAPGKQNAHPTEPKQDIHFTRGTRSR
jgi:outer membrane receptor protein involved in Fe transport